jgi:hypothetical protein
VYNTQLDIKAPIRQGDIFRWLPKVEISLGPANLPQVTEPKESGKFKEIDWFKLSQNNGSAFAYINVRPVTGIVISQDCDTSRAENIAFCEIKPFGDVEGLYNDELKPKSYMKIITDQSRKNQKWYYLAENETLEFFRKMGVDFESVFEVPRLMLETHKERLRIGRLDDEVAWPHFRERVAEFFRRYPYNEWYPFNSDEAQLYEDLQKHINPNFVLDTWYRWQKH